ncbi:hypothetical protein JRO89_XS04G0049400 [Xanthoceras sorbifolium]|uniref:Uncharacterized protein n=1 Tax=Xanthoceras sorbifolium TaxID=99658 RepID=A0ABQ8I457_9ROSI|nr:hypothetical protein JRO89_XS04G0049400 [Xanthoceras sorbifolium]
MGIPLLLGVSDETQKLTIKILRHKEGNRRTEAIRVILSSRAGSSRLPQLYEAEIILNSRLPWTKEFIERVRSLERYEKGASESMRKWQLSRRKRKAIFLQERVPEVKASSASSSVRVSGEEDIGDSESVYSQSEGYTMLSNM